MSNLYKLGDYEIDPMRRQLRLNGEPVLVAQKPFEVLLYLLDRPGQVVTKEELMQAIWPEAFVEEANLTQSIFILRKALQDKASGSRYITTIPGRGYQLAIAPVPFPEPAPPLTTVPLDPSSGSLRSNRKNRIPTILAVSIFALALLLFAGWRLLRYSFKPQPTFTLTRLTNSGDVQATAISASGTYFGYASKDALGSGSLSITDLRTQTSRVILHSDLEVFEDLTFPPGDLYLYYRSYLKSDPEKISSEHRIPLLGGEPILVVRDLDGPVTFLANSNRVCYWRGLGDDRYLFLSADADSGKDEKTLATSPAPLPNYAACAPDGQKAAISTEVGGVSILEFKSGQRRPFYQSDQTNEIFTSLLWKADSTALIGTSVTPFDMYPRLLLFSYPGATRRPITQDIDSYATPGMTADGDKIIARQRSLNTQFQSFNLPLLGADPEVTAFPWTTFLGWDGDDTIVGSTVDGGIKKKVVESGQENLIQTLNGMHFLQPNGCGPAALVASGSQNAHKEIAIWHMDRDGSSLVQLTPGPEDILPACSPDGRWVVYADNSARRKAAIYRVPAKGGSPVMIVQGSVWFAISHKGDKIAWIQEDGRQRTLVQADLESGRHISNTPVPPELNTSRSITFSPDDHHVFLIAQGNTSDSIYDLPLDGSAPLKQIEFRGARLSTIIVSPTGKHLGVVTAKPVSDAVLLQKTNQ